MLSFARLPDHAERAHPGIGFGEHPVKTVHASKPGSVFRNRFGRRALRLPPPGAKCRDVGKDVPRVPRPAFPGDHARLARAILTHGGVREFPSRELLPPPATEDPAE